MTGSTRKLFIPGLQTPESGKADKTPPPPKRLPSYAPPSPPKRLPSYVPPPPHSQISNKVAYTFALAQYEQESVRTVMLHLKDTPRYSAKHQCQRAVFLAQIKSSSDFVKDLEFLEKLKIENNLTALNNYIESMRNFKENLQIAGEQLDDEWLNVHFDLQMYLSKLETRCDKLRTAMNKLEQGILLDQSFTENADAIIELHNAFIEVQETNKNLRLKKEVTSVGLLAEVADVKNDQPVCAPLNIPLILDDLAYQSGVRDHAARVSLQIKYRQAKKNLDEVEKNCAKFLNSKEYQNLLRNQAIKKVLLFLKNTLLSKENLKEFWAPQTVSFFCFGGVDIHGMRVQTGIGSIHAELNRSGDIDSLESSLTSACWNNLFKCINSRPTSNVGRGSCATFFYSEFKKLYQIKNLTHEDANHFITLMQQKLNLKAAYTRKRFALPFRRF